MLFLTYNGSNNSKLLQCKLLNGVYNYFCTINDTEITLDFPGTNDFRIAFDLVNGFIGFLYPNLDNHGVINFDEFFNNSNINFQKIKVIKINAKSFGSIFSHYFIVSILKNIDKLTIIDSIITEIFGPVGVHESISKKIVEYSQELLTHRRALDLEINIKYVIRMCDPVCSFFSPFLFNKMCKLSNLKNKHKFSISLVHLITDESENFSKYFTKNSYKSAYSNHRYDKNMFCSDFDKIVYKQSMKSVDEYFSYYLNDTYYLRRTSYFGLVKFLNKFYKQTNWFNYLTSALICNYKSVDSGVYGSVNFYYFSIHIFQYYCTLNTVLCGSVLMQSRSQIFSTLLYYFCSLLSKILKPLILLRNKNFFILNIIYYLTLQSLRIFEIIYFTLVLICCSILRQRVLSLF